MRISDWSSDVCSSDLIIEVVGDPAGELSYRLHLLRLAQRLFRFRAFADLGLDPFFQPLVKLVQPVLGRLPLGNVDHRPDKARSLIGIEERASARGNPPLPSILEDRKSVV